MFEGQNQKNLKADWRDEKVEVSGQLQAWGLQFECWWR